MVPAYFLAQGGQSSVAIVLCLLRILLDSQGQVSLHWGLEALGSQNLNFPRWLSQTDNELGPFYIYPLIPGFMYSTYQG